jgi:hypothetical protein
VTGIKQTILTGLLMLLSTGVAAAQAQAQAQGDACHVYVVDLEKAEKVVKQYFDNGDPKAAPPRGADAGETVFPEFYTKVGEEELTTKGYPFPGSKLFITASVFYTDESMRAESMLVGVLVSDKLQKEALWGENTAVAEVTYDDNTDIVRAKQRLRVGGRLYVVGIECRCKAAAASK